ncbi:hypothetical protein [Acidipropionibacterium jensenii]|uniref:hypothetical protein n=1 Tax=Acidipropionibacterium jensenii TaxID=1749 RepID=UPI00214B15DA|nr:hypothetical protein [Acidipropionibacterium jensenii]
MTDFGGAALEVAYNPVPAAGRVARHQATRVRLALQALVIVAVVALIWAIARSSFDLGTLMGMLIGWAVVFVVMFTIQNLRLRAARKDLLTINEGTVLRLDPSGIAMRREQRVAGSGGSGRPGRPGGSAGSAGAQASGPEAGSSGEPGDSSPEGVPAHPADPALDLVRWPEVAEFAVLGSSLGAGPVVRLVDSGGHRWEVPVSWLDALPGTIDSAARAWSGGRTGLDVTGLDRPF